MTVMTKEQIKALLDNDPGVLGQIARDALNTSLALHQQLADAEAAQALVVERAAKEPAQAAFRAGARGPREASILHDAAADAERAIRALASTSGVKELAALRAERDEWKRKHGELQDLATEHNTAVAKNTIALTSRAQKSEAERDDLRARLAAAEAQVGALREALIDHNDILRSTFHIAEREGVKGMVASTNWDAFYNRVAVILKRYHKLRNEASTALASAQGVKHD